LEEELATNVTQTGWRELAELTLSRVIVFNGRRGDEAALLKVQTFAERGCGHVQVMVKEAMNDVNKELFEKYALVFMSSMLSSSNSA